MIFPPPAEEANRLHPRPQLGLPFPFPLTRTSHGWSLKGIKVLTSKHERWNGGGARLPPEAWARARARARACVCVCGTAADCVCSTPSASLRGRFGKVISGSSGQGLRWSAGGHQHQDLQTNGFTRCDHDLMRCEGGRGGVGANGTFPLKEKSWMM